MVNEDYLACSAYEGQTKHDTATDFSAFFHEETQQYFFALLDADAKVLLKSEGYPQPAARENGIQSVIKNRINRDFYSVKEDDGRYYLSLRAANYREIARSCHVDSEGDALALIAYATGEEVRGGVAATVADTKERANDRIDDDYMACKSYAGYGGAGNAVVGFTHESGQHYFAWYDDDGDVLMRSEGYPTTAARDNGMASVAKNGELEERYAVLEKMGRYFVILKAGNHQEIARSCPYDSEAAARAIFPSGRAETARLKAEAAAAAIAAAKAEQEAIAAAKAAEEAAAAAKAEEEAATIAAATAAAAVSATADTATSDRREDNYLACRQYDGHEGADDDGFTKWQHSNGQYYFSWLDDNGKVKMRSEGYPTTAARDNGVDSVMRNRDNADRYKVIELAGKTFVILKAGNHQEIARSCPKEDRAAVWAMFPLLAPPDVAAARELEATDDIATVADIEDDYLSCREYHGHMTAPRDGFRVFISNKTDKYYFAVVDADDDVTLRSEGHLTAAERDADLADVVQNMLKKDRYEIKHVGLHHYFIVLRNAAGKEIARSCGHDSLTSVYAAAPFLNPEKPAAKIDIAAPLTIGATAVAAAVATRVVEPPVTPSVPPPPADVEDDYLPCREYEGKTINDKGNNVSMFKHSNGQFYFAVYHADGQVRLRSEGFRTSQDRDKELSGVLKNLNNADMYTTIRRGEYYISVLKDKTGREVGRSCMQKDPISPVVVPPIVAPAVLVAAATGIAAAVPEVKVATPPPPVYVAPKAAEAVTSETGFNWWWLLLPLLALLGWLLMGKGCSEPAAPTAVIVAPPVEAPKVAPTPEPTAVVPAAPSCDLSWILFDFDKADITTIANGELAEMAKILKDNKDYIGVLSAHTDGKGSIPYNEDLSRRRAAAAKRVLIGMGIESARLKTEADGKGKPIAQNTEDDAGRQFNRRVELYVRDKTGKDICQSIPPAIPDALKTK